MKSGHIFTLDEQRVRILAGSYPLEGDAADCDHIAFLLVEAAITDGVVSGGDPYSLAADRLADGDGDLDGYNILLYIASGYWLRSPIKRASYFTGPADILRDLTEEANAMARLVGTMRKRRQLRQGIRRILTYRAVPGTASGGRSV